MGNAGGSAPDTPANSLPPTFNPTFLYFPPTSPHIHHFISDAVILAITINSNITTFASTSTDANADATNSIPNTNSTANTVRIVKNNFCFIVFECNLLIVT